MSLLDQSLQTFPTSVLVTVHQARNVRVKGKNGTNDAYAIIQVAKDKFSTAVAEKSVAPVWKEEASFDLPLFHPGNAERCTLYIIVMHRAQVGLDKFLGQAVINLVELYDNKSRKKTDWFKLVNKDKKEDKVRGEVLLDIQFMRNNMSASMFDLSQEDKPRSRISKLKDKVRGKKKDGFSDSASAIVPSVNQVLTDSEGEADAQSLSQSPQGKKKSKFKTLFAPKSNLHRNISQSMSTLGTLPEKNSSLSGSRSSGLNVDSPEGKKKFKLLGHKRTGSSDSKVSLGAFSLLGRSKQGNNDLNNLCINGNHVYAKEAEAKTGSTLSLNSSGQGSVEDVRKHTSDAFADSAISLSVPSFREEPDKALMEQQHHQEEEMKRLAEEKRIAEAKRLEEEEKYRVAAKRLQEDEQRRHQEEQERRRRAIEDETRRKKQKEEEDERRKQEEERRVLEAAENRKLEEERKRAEEQKRQEEASMSDRLSSLFGMIRGREEKKEEVQPQIKEEWLSNPASGSVSKGPDHSASSHSTNPLEDISLSSDFPHVRNQSPSDHQKPNHNQQTPSSMTFLNRTTKVSAVKPRSAQILESEPADCQSPSQPCPSQAHSDGALERVDPESPETFSKLLTSLSSSNISQDLTGSPHNSTENLSFLESGRSSPTMADQKRKPPSYPVNGTQNRGSQGHIREIQNPMFEETDGLQQEKKISLPLPDYETLFSKKRHGVKGQTQWDNLVAEVSQKHREYPPELMGPEMSVDGPAEAEPAPSPRSSISRDYAAMRKFQKTKPASFKKSSPSTSKQAASQVPQTVVDSYSSIRQEDKKAHVSLKKEAPIAKPRQRVGGNEPKQQEESAVKTSLQTLSSSNVSSKDQKEQENFAQPSTESPSKLGHNQEVDIFTRNLQTEQKPEHDHFDKIITQEKTTDTQSASETVKQNDHSKTEDSKQLSPTLQRKNSQRGKKTLPAKIHSENKTLVSEEEPESEEANEIFSASDGSNTLLPQIDLKTQISLYAGKAPIRAESFYAPSSQAPSESLPMVLEEPASQTENLSGGKTPLRAWVSPSDIQPVSTPNSSGGGLGLSARRPHPVKPMSSESQHPTSSPAVKEIRVWDTTPGKTKGGDSGGGPYSQLTQEELITLVVKQQTDLSKKSAKIEELEQYIDNLLVRVIEEQPSILQALNAKPV